MLLPRLELGNLSAYAPQAYVFANFTTRAFCGSSSPIGEEQQNLSLIHHPIYRL